MHFQASKHAILLLFSLLLLHFHNPISAVEPVFVKCYDSSNYTSGSQYETNLKKILPSLSINGVLLKDRYYNTTEGNGPNKIYGFSQCMSAASEDDCRECLIDSTAKIIRLCPNRTQAALQHYNCILRYSNQNFSQPDSAIEMYAYPVQNVSNVMLFYTRLGGLMNDLSSMAASAASKYAVKVMSYSYFHNVYGLAQCTRDLSESLTKMIYATQSCCDGRTGGNVYSVSCNIRYDMYSFFTLHSPPPPPSVAESPQGSGYMPPPPPSVVAESNINEENNQTVNFSKKRIRLLAIILPLAIFGILIMVSMCYFLRNRFKRQDKSPFCSRRWRKKKNREVEPKACNTLKCGEDIVELPLYTFGSIMAATNNFSIENMLGEGGFGKVYKGNLNQEMEIAVKRLSKSSAQGEEEFKNEIQLITKLQHKNLVRLLGLCVHGEEKILIYEFMLNKSLDKFLFDPTKKLELDWKKRFNIIQGVAQGLLYLHHYSRLRVIHRDLKTSNILLDASMTPKISDFGLARIFQGNQTEANTNRVMGTYGYMSPEYALDGIFSEKSDVYSFGVLMLEILSAKKNKGFYPSKYSINLVGFAWQLWIEGKGIELVDPSMDGSFVTREVMTCIHVALLCVQEDPADRPDMSSVVSMVGNESITLPSPKQPAFPTVRLDVHSARNISNNSSINGVTLSTVGPR